MWPWVVVRILAQCVVRVSGFLGPNRFFYVGSYIGKFLIIIFALFVHS